MKLIRIACLLLAVALMSPQAAAQGKGKGKGLTMSKGPDKTKFRTSPSKGGIAVGVSLEIGPSEKGVITGYVASHRNPRVRGHGLPPGLAKQVAVGRSLPPGWQRKCIVGAIMPLPVFEVCHPLPVEIQIKLPPAPPDTRLVAVEGSVFRISTKTRKIHSTFVVSP